LDTVILDSESRINLSIPRGPYVLEIKVISCNRDEIIKKKDKKNEVGYVDLITCATALATVMLARSTSPGPRVLDSRKERGESNKESCLSELWLMNPYLIHTIFIHIPPLHHIPQTSINLTN
jgi:hypothetical protein